MHSNIPSQVELFFSRDGEAWRLYLRGWVAPYLRSKLDEHGEAFPVRAPDLDDLNRYMWTVDAPYTKRVTTLGGVEIDAKGRSAVALWEWLDEHLS